MKKCFTLLFLMCIGSFAFGQSMSSVEAEKPLQKGERIVETIVGSELTLNGILYDMSCVSKVKGATTAYAYAKAKYAGEEVFLRNYVWVDNGPNACDRVLSFDIVEKMSGDYIVGNYLNKAFDKALMNIREGSRFSIDQVTVIGDITSEINKETLKDNVIDVLLDRGYKVVAKEYLEKLYQEQEKQQSGIYNENTTVQENNFSAVGYFLNIKITDESLRVQVVNVSTGEYEGNATITF